MQSLEFAPRLVRLHLHLFTPWSPDNTARVPTLRELELELSRDLSTNIIVSMPAGACLMSNPNGAATVH